MKSRTRAKIFDALHRSRMQPYLVQTGGNEKDALRLYRWNLELTAAVQEVLGVTEVVLRNAMDRELQAWNVKRAGRSGSWLLQEPATPLRGLTAGKRQSALNRAQKEAGRRAVDHPRHGVPVSHDDVLAQVMFGMWKDLLPNHHPQASRSSLDNSNRRLLWDAALKNSFPNEVDPEGEKAYWRVVHVHHLRNRVSHMEPLLGIDVGDRMREAFALVRSIDPAVAEWVSGISRVQDVAGRRPGR